MSAPPSSRNSASRSSSRRSSSPSRRPARRSFASSAAASATPTSTRPPAPIRPGTPRACSGTRARASSSAVGDGVTLVAPGDHVVTLFAPECGKCIHCLSPRTNRCVAIRDQQGLGYLPDGTTRFSRDGEALRHFMGTSTFAEYTVMPEIALAKVNPRGAARRLRAVRLRPLDRASAPRSTRPRSSQARPASSSAAGSSGSAP